MSDIDIRLECLRIAAGSVDQAQALYDFVTRADRQKADVAKPQGVQGVNIPNAVPCPSCGRYPPIGLGQLGGYGLQQASGLGRYGGVIGRLQDGEQSQ